MGGCGIDPFIIFMTNAYWLVLCYLSSLISASPLKKKPPPIAPKPKALRALSSDDTITYEPSSSFEDVSMQDS